MRLRLVLSLTFVIRIGTLLSMSPQKEYAYSPDSLGLSYEDLRIKTSDSFGIHAWLMRPAPVYDKRTTVILSGGDAGNMSSQVYLAYNLVMQGYTVITYDYRGFGSSDTFNLKRDLLYCNEFERDLTAVMQYANKQMPLNKLGLISYSMGSIVSAMALQHEQADFFIVEGLVYNPLLISARLQVLQSKVVYLPDSAEKIKDYYAHILCPMLVFAGESDVITTLSDAKIVCGMTNNRSLLSYPGAHLEGMLKLSKKSLGDIYFKKIFKFLKKQGF